MYLLGANFSLKPGPISISPEFSVFRGWAECEWQRTREFHWGYSPAGNWCQQTRGRTSTAWFVLPQQLPNSCVLFALFYVDTHDAPNSYKNDVSRSCGGLAAQTQRGTRAWMEKLVACKSICAFAHSCPVSVSPQRLCLLEQNTNPVQLRRHCFPSSQRPFLSASYGGWIWGSFFINLHPSWF